MRWVGPASAGAAAGAAVIAAAATAWVLKAGSPTSDAPAMNPQDGHDAPSSPALPSAELEVFPLAVTEVAQRLDGARGADMVASGVPVLRVAWNVRPPGEAWPGFDRQIAMINEGSLPRGAFRLESISPAPGSIFALALGLAAMHSRRRPGA